MVDISSLKLAMSRWSAGALLTRRRMSACAASVSPSLSRALTRTTCARVHGLQLAATLSTEPPSSPRRSPPSIEPREMATVARSTACLGLSCSRYTCASVACVRQSLRRSSAWGEPIESRKR